MGSNQVDEQLAQLRREVDRLERDLAALMALARVRADHKEGRHGEASVPACPLCPREMTADQLPGGPPRPASATLA